MRWRVPTDRDGIVKSPDELAAILARQWHAADQRAHRLLDAGAWPIRLPIGRPAAALFERRTAEVRAHVARWRNVAIGEVCWQETRYRSAAARVSLPQYWLISSAEEWVQASADTQVQFEFQRLRRLLDATDRRFHSLLVRQRSLWRDRDEAEVLQAVALSLALEPGIAGGRPLRGVAAAGVDSKFIERNRALVTALLDIRFEGQASQLGLASFLDASDEGDHWLLVVPMSPALLPFAQQRVRARELARTPLPGERILLIENDRCLHLLPELPGTIAVLGSGLDLAWLDADWLGHRRLAYWGDMDTWGLCMLARARTLQPALQPLLMDRALFERFGDTLAVVEPVTAGPIPPPGLDEQERAFYCYLLTQQKGRMEQERLPEEAVAQALRRWVSHG